MALPTYDKSKRKKAFEQLPKDAYVVKIMNAKETQNKETDGSHVAIAFDIAEGEYKGFYKDQFDRNTNEDKKWPNDAIYRLTIPGDNSPQYVWDNWNTFFADLEDSNGGFVFDGDTAKLKGKIFGGKMFIEQSEYKGKIYNHTRLRWTCIVDDVRNGKAAKNMPNDKLIASGSGTATGTTSDGFVNIADGVKEDEIPFN